MKKILIILLTVVTAAGLALLSVSAEESVSTNYLTHKWADNFFPGQLSETEEDGETVTTYISNYQEPWFSPHLSVYDDLKKLAEGKDYIEFSIHMEIRGVFLNDTGESTCSFLFRAVDPGSGKYSYNVDKTYDWDGKGNSWLDIYTELLDDGDLFFKIDGGGNVMSDINPRSADLLATEWTEFDTEPILVSAAALSDDLFGDLILCFDTGAGFVNGLTGVQIRRTAIYDVNENVKTPAPTEAATDTAAGTASQKPDATAPSEATAPAVKTDAPAKTPTANTGKGVNPGLIIGIVCGCAAVIAVLTVIVISKKKGGK